MASPSTPHLTAGPALFALDLALAALLWPAALVLAASTMPSAGDPGLVHAVLYPLGYLTFAYALGLYRRDALQATRKSLARVPFAAALGGVVASVLVLLLPLEVGRVGASALFVAGWLCMTLAGWLARVTLFAARKQGKFRRRVLIIGAGQRAWEMMLLLRREGRTLSYDIGFAHDPKLGALDPRLADTPYSRIIESNGDYLAIAEKFGADQIVVAVDERRGMAMEALLACKTAGYPVYEYLRFLEDEIGRVDLKRMELGWLLYADGFTFSQLDLVLKRALDLTASAVLLLMSSPFLLAAALAVKLDDPGPALYRQARVTRGNRVFHILKLRTMRVDAEKLGAQWAAAKDARITRIGRFLRRTRLDELPQLINVLKGEMSFVGPRPERPEFTQKLAEQLPLYNERHLVKAGLTGWAQVNYPYGASLDDARSKLSYDLYYVKNFGVLFDVLIMLQTLRVVLWPGGGVR
jgi:sugar transferase (PEP-CTERM system associated)